MDRHRMIEVHPASGGDWGSCRIDRKIRNLFEKIFTSKFIENVKTEDPETHLRLKEEFQKMKLEFCFNVGST